MKNTIEILDKDTNTKQTYVLKEKPEASGEWIEVFKNIFKLILKMFQFGLYCIVSILQMFINIIKGLFLNGYEPFKWFYSGDNILDRIAYRNINREKIRFTSDYLCRHEYNFTRSEKFLAQYKHLQIELKKISDNKVLINDDIYKDIFKRISILISEVENVALKEGYNYARETKYKLYDNDIYEDYIRDKVLKGASNTDWKDLEVKLDEKSK